MDNIDSEFISAARYGRLDDVIRLHGEGAKINAKDRSGWTALMSADNPDVAEFLIINGANMEAKNNNGRTAMMCAAEWSGNLETIAILVKYGAKVNEKDYYGSTALDIAIRLSHDDIVQFLRSEAVKEQKQVIEDAKPVLQRLQRNTGSKRNRVR